MEESRKLSWVKFSFEDWSNDVALQRCSMGARGFWMEVLRIMHQGQPYGHLQTNGQPITIKELSSMVHLGPREDTKNVKRWLAELEKFGVFSRTKEGVVYSRRMLRDEANRSISREFGKLGGSPYLRQHANPPVKAGVKALVKAGVKGGVNPPVKAGVKLRVKKLEVETERPLTPPGGVLAAPESKAPETATAPGPDPNANPPRQAGINLRALGLNPRALNQNPRAQGMNPRTVQRRSIELRVVQSTIKRRADESAFVYDMTPDEMAEIRRRNFTPMDGSKYAVGATG